MKNNNGSSYVKPAAQLIIVAILASSTVSAVQSAECNSNYAGQCVPIVSDVDCAGGNGDGPAFVQGPVKVIGSDPYRLDRDKDGVACEPKEKKAKATS